MHRCRPCGRECEVHRRRPCGRKCEVHRCCSCGRECEVRRRCPCGRGCEVRRRRPCGRGRGVRGCISRSVCSHAQPVLRAWKSPAWPADTVAEAGRVLHDMIACYRLPATCRVRIERALSLPASCHVCMACAWRMHLLMPHGACACACTWRDAPHRAGGGNSRYMISSRYWRAGCHEA
jgi:hypothetical protein